MDRKSEACCCCKPHKRGLVHRWKHNEVDAIKRFTKMKEKLLGISYNPELIESYE